MVEILASTTLSLFFIRRYPFSAAAYAPLFVSPFPPYWISIFIYITRTTYNKVEEECDDDEEMQLFVLLD